MADAQPSIVKSLFQGEILEELAFPYPTMDPEEVDMVKILIDSITKWAGENLDAAEADEQARYPEGTLEASPRRSRE